MKHQPPSTVRVFCGELCQSSTCTSNVINLLHSDYNGLSANMTIGLDRFVEDSEELSLRVVDLLQIAAYVFGADRMANRGERDSINYESWARSFEFHVPVLDYDFWENANVKKALCETLAFMTGDRKYSFCFQKTDNNPARIKDKQLSFFEGEQKDFNGDVMLFSGGLDSLAGAIERLNEYQDRSICIVSHRSNKTVTHTQRVLIEHLNNKYAQRVKPYGFECCNRNGLKSKDETQRTRIFLFAAIAFALCNYYKKHEFYIYENGITSLNLSKQVDVINARASRTTHPKTVGLLRKFFKLFDSEFKISTPYYNKTKAEIMHVFERYGEKDIIASSVSCSSSRTKPGQAAHCGCCSQCIDRRFSVFAAGLDEFDAPYATDFITRLSDDDHHETKQRLYNTLRFACKEEISTQDDFIEKYPSELTDIIEYWPGKNAEDKFSEVYSLICRYGESVFCAATRMRNQFDNLLQPVNKNSLIGIIADRMYMRTPYYIRVEEIDSILKKSIPVSFQREKPKSENDFNDKVEAILNAHEEFTREYPVIQFGASSYRADHGRDNLVIECKYIRGRTSPSKASEGIAADITKISEEYGVLFVVYDPDGAIANASTFISTFEQKRNNCFVRIYR